MSEKPDISTAIIAALDAQRALVGALDFTQPLSIMPEDHEWHDARLAVLLWATAHGGARRDADDDDIRVIHISIRVTRGRRVREVQVCTLHVPDGHDFDPKPTKLEDHWRPSDVDPMGARS